MKPPPENPLIRPTDAARRLSDAVALALTVHGFDAAGKYLAVKLRDGSTDGVLYDDRGDAIRFQRSMDPMCYVRIAPDGMSVREAETFLSAHRTMHDAGYRIPHPHDRGDLSPEIELPGRLETWTSSGLILPPSVRPRRGTM